MSIYKTKEDIQRVIKLGKPDKVVDVFIESYLTGEALAPYLEVEQEYTNLLAQDDVPDVEQVVDPETLEVTTEGYSPNAIRDARIAELEADYPYLIEVEETTVESRRPVLEVDVLGWKVSTGMLKDSILSAVQAKLDSGAQALGYDSINSIGKYLGYDNAFRTECESLGSWTASCWAKCYEILAAVEAGTRGVPTVDEVLAELPTL